MTLKANSEQPLWLPRGSVRAILALILVLAAVVGILLKIGDIQILVALIGPVVGFYFAKDKQAPPA
jgi:uncharacterized membrane protein YccC